LRQGARTAGADIIAEPETQFYGDRTYRAKDPEGHIWTFGVTVEEKTAERMGRRGRLHDQDAARRLSAPRSSEGARPDAWARSPTRPGDARSSC
jgi:hypothetical protein